jgi:hypothetical protein
MSRGTPTRTNQRAPMHTGMPGRSMPMPKAMVATTTSSRLAVQASSTAVRSRSGSPPWYTAQRRAGVTEGQNPRRLLPSVNGCGCGCGCRRSGARAALATQRGMAAATEAASMRRCTYTIAQPATCVIHGWTACAVSIALPAANEWRVKGYVWCLCSAVPWSPQAQAPLACPWGDEEPGNPVRHVCRLRAA